ncbi:MAG: chemotaxis response regulator protein-glutamate methylesterase [Succinivibrionaceae bacterium]
MVYKVLVVDDSTFFRKRLAEIIQQDSELELVGQASDGKESLDMVATLKPHVITMDVEMPIMNGIDAVREIMKNNPTPILMFSSLTKEGADATIRALEAGALDFLPKNFDDISRRKIEAIDAIKMKLKILAKCYNQVSILGNSSYLLRTQKYDTNPSIEPKSGLISAHVHKSGGFRSTLNSNLNHTSSRLISSMHSVHSNMSSLCDKPSLYKISSNGKYKLVAIGCSTGGPIALREILPKFPSGFPLPIIIMQHMPETFTGSFAKRLDALCNLPVTEAKSGDILENGHIYLAPGGKQMLVEKVGIHVCLKIVESPPHINFKPSVDMGFGSAAQVFGNAVLAVVLTGMGNDGAKGAKLLRQKGSTVWAQDRETCLIYGMPKAVVEAGLAQKILPLEAFGDSIVKEVLN